MFEQCAQVNIATIGQWLQLVEVKVVSVVVMMLFGTMNATIKEVCCALCRKVH